MKAKRYPGISPFSTDQKDIFFGREEDINKLNKLILLRNQVLIYSKSGIGKTSLLNAGILPKLEEDFKILKIRFFAYDNDKSQSPINTIMQNLADVQIPGSDDTNSFLDKLIEGTNYKKTLWYYFKQIQFKNIHSRKYILVFDQFEELFTYPINQINQFKEQLYELTRVNIPDKIMELIAEKQDFDKDKDVDILYNDLTVKTVFAIRSDHLSFLNELTDKLHDIQEVFYELKPLNDSQAKQAIIKPAQKFSDFESPPFEFDKKALETTIAALSNHGTQNIETTQLQIVCQKIEDIAIGKVSTGSESEKLIIFENDLPKFEDIFLSFYNDSIEKISCEKGNDEQINARKFIEQQLIRNNQRISLDEIVCKDYVNINTLKSLVDSHLLRAEHNTTGGLSYELSHDTLISPVTYAKQEREKEEKDLREKMHQNKSYLLINILQAPIIILILALIFRFKSPDVGFYTFYDNINIPFYLFSLSIIVQFLGLAAGSKEMIREWKFSTTSYDLGVLHINKKIGLIFFISTIQILLLVLTGNIVLKVKGMDYYYWLILISSAISANIAGLFISYLFKNQGLVNGVIVLLLVAQIFLSGFLLSYQNLNPVFNSVEKTPFIGDLMPARWSYEALMVKQAKDNKYEKPFYKFDKIISDSKYYRNYWNVELKGAVYYCINNVGNEEVKSLFQKKLLLISNEFETIQTKYGFKTDLVKDLRSFKFDNEIQQKCFKFIEEVRQFFINEHILADNKKNNLVDNFQTKDSEAFLKSRDNYLNQSLQDLVTNENQLYKTLETANNKIFRNFDFIYYTSDSRFGRSNLYAPNKRIGNILIDTYWYNLLVIWLMSFGTYSVLICIVKFKAWSQKKNYDIY
jgi:hypothetical protein